MADGGTTSGSEQAAEDKPLTAPREEMAGQPQEAASSAPAGSEPPPEPRPLDVPLEEQINALPPVAFPGQADEEFRKWADDKRRKRIRIEVYGGVVLLVAGVIASIVSQRPTFIVIALFAVGGLAAYEFLVNSFE